MINFFDLDKQYFSVRKDYLKILDSIMKKGDLILGREVKTFEKKFAKFCQTKFAVGVNSGTDALFLSLKCLEIGMGDEVIVPAFTFIATSFAVSYTGAKPVFVDIDENTYTIDTTKIAKSITKKTKAIIPVHLFGLCANMPEILEIAKKNKLYVIEDAAQAHGAQIKNKQAGSMGEFGCFSFYPTKNLSASGDAGIITTNSTKFYQKLLQLRDCGRVKKRYLHTLIGYNSRLDNIQAALLLLKLRQLKKWNRERINNAIFYSKLLQGIKGVTIPKIPKNFKHVFHLYSIRTKKRKKLITEFDKYKIPYSIFYRLPLHLQKANSYLKYKKGDFSVSEKVCKEILSLPIHANLQKKDILRIVSIIKRVHNG